MTWPWRRWIESACRRAPSTCPRSCLAARCSASPSRGPSSPTRSPCSATSRPATSTRRQARKSWPCSGPCPTLGDRQWSWSRTTCARRSTATGWCAFATAWWRRKKKCEAVMWSLYRTLSLRYLRMRWARAVLVAASICLGVATLVATRALNHSMWSATRTAATPLAVADLFVSNGDTGVRHDLAAAVAKVRRVRVAEPLVRSRVRLPDLGDHRHAQLLGIVWRPDVVENNPWGVTIEWLIAPDAIPGVRGTNPQNLLSHLKRFGLQPVLIGNELADKMKPAPVDGRLEKALQFLKQWNKELADQLETVPIRVQGVGQE